MKKVYEKGREIIEEVEREGGMTKMIMSGKPKLKIEESATRRQALIDSGKEVIVGVNKYRLSSSSSSSSSNSNEKVEVRMIDNSKVRQSQIQRIQSVKSKRDPLLVSQALSNLSQSARSSSTSSPSQNLLLLSIEAARSPFSLYLSFLFISLYHTISFFSLSIYHTISFLIEVMNYFLIFLLYIFNHIIGYNMLA